MRIVRFAAKRLLRLLFTLDPRYRRNLLLLPGNLPDGQTIGTVRVRNPFKAEAAA